jgi:hypothetical protein
MRSLGPEPKTLQKAAPAFSARPGRTLCEQGREVSRILRSEQGTEETRAGSCAEPANSEAQEGSVHATPRSAHDFSRIQVSSNAPLKPQAKLAINAPGDSYEQEADRAAAQVMQVSEPRLQRACACGGACSACQTERFGREAVALQTKPVHAGSGGEIAAPPIVQEVLASPGQPLDPATRTFMDSRFGHDFSHVRVHTDQRAAQSADAVAAHAYTVGADVVFGAGRYAPESGEGRRLLAHELTHVVQQHAGATASLQRFEAKERDKIAPTFTDMMAIIKTIIDASTSSGLISDDLNMSDFVEKSGGYSAGRQIDKKLSMEQPHVKSMLLPRYLFTCRCGLIDMRHFIQLFYMSNFAAGFEGVSQSGANRYATRKGREHELDAESKSRFAPEDAPSNALGAFSNIGLAAMPGPDAVLNAIKDTLTRCSPVDFKSLSTASQNTIVNFYGAQVPDPTPKKSGDLIPEHQNQTAVPDVLDIKECGGTERSFPFSLDQDDPDRKTISDTDFGQGSAGLKKGREMRDFINTQRPEVLKALPISEKIRMLKVLLGGKVSDEDLKSAELLNAMMTPAEKEIWNRQLPLPTDD